MERTLEWAGGAIVTVDQTLLPGEYRQLRLGTVDELVDAIRRLAIRGAMALGAAGGLGVALSAHLNSSGGVVDEAAVAADAEKIATARPTAANLAWGVRRALACLSQGPGAVLAEALAMLAEDEQVNRAAARRAADFLLAACPRRPLRVLTHCNAGRLAAVAWGSALGTVYDLAGRGQVEEVLACEARPLLQGARLTVWELAEAGIPHKLCVDSAGPAAIAAGLVDCVVVGADRISANGDVANKIGTYSLALAAARAGIPFVVVAPESTVDAQASSGSQIVVEQRAPEEVTHLAGHPVAPAGTRAFNPAFDVTPALLVTAIATERRLLGGGQPRGEHPPGSLPAEVAAQLRVMADFPRPGVAFQDLAGVYATPGLLHGIARSVGHAFAGKFGCVLAIEARGFTLGSAVALATGQPLVLARKPGKLPGKVMSAEYDLEYGSAALEIQCDAIRPGSRVLAVDDVLATGGTLAAAAELIERGGSQVAGLGVIVEIPALGGRAKLSSYDVHAIHAVS